MTNKIDVCLDNIDGKNQLIFNLTNGKTFLDLESDDSDSIKKVFLELLKEIEKNPIELNLITGEKFDESNNKLFLDASKEYINKLNEEIKTLETDDDLAYIREKNKIK